MFTDNRLFTPSPGAPHEKRSAQNRGCTAAASRPLPYHTKHCHAAVASHGGLTHLFAKRSVIGLQTSNMINAKHGHEHDHDNNDNDDDEEEASM